MTARKTKKSEEPDFEQAMAGLEETVRRLEAGDLPLEESLAAFEKGVALVRSLHTRLDSVQTRIDELTQGAAGEPVLKSLPGAGEEDASEEDPE